MKPAGGQYVPGGHLSYIFITDEAFYGIMIGPCADGACPFLGEPGITDPVEQERDMVHGFVGMIVIIVPHHIFRSMSEQRFQVLLYLLLSAHEPDHTGNILRNEPALLIGIAFHGAIVLLQATGGWPGFPGSVFFTGPEPVGGIIETIPVVQCFAAVGG